MPDRILNQIQWLCKEIPKVEWSGILFYSIEGTIREPEKMVLTLKDILPMQKGTASYTEYSFDERVIDYRMENEEADEWKVAHIHSHNTMGVFFSGTDWEELEDNAPNHNIYLSLIVNNFMDFCAKVAFIAEVKESKEFEFISQDENGEKYVYSTAQYEVDEAKIVTYDCEIISSNVSITVEEDFSNRVAEIIKTSNINTVVYNNNKYVSPINKQNASVGFSGRHSTPGAQSWVKKDKDYSVPQYDDEWDEWGYGSSHDAEIEAFESAEDKERDMYDDYATFVLALGEDFANYSDMEEVIDKYIQSRVSPIEVANLVIAEYIDSYITYFSIKGSIEEAHFIEATEKVIIAIDDEKYSENRLQYMNMYKAVLEVLGELLIKYKENGFSKVK